MIPLPNAVVDPGAVVVVALDTHVASRAVSGARRPHHLTFRAEVDRVDQLHQFKEVDLLRPRDLPWVTELSPGPEEYGENAEATNDVERIRDLPNWEENQYENREDHEEKRQERQGHLNALLGLRQGRRKHQAAARVCAVQVADDLVLEALRLDLLRQRERCLAIKAPNVPRGSVLQQGPQWAPRLDTFCGTDRQMHDCGSIVILNI